MHPSVRVIALLMFAIAAYAVHGLGLVFTFMVMLICLIFLGLLMPHWTALNASPDSGDDNQTRRFWGVIEFFKLLRRVRYILLFLLIVYAFNTPGEYLPGWYFEMAPTYEGIVAGIEQALRLSLILAGLAILLVTTNRDQLIAGLYYLAFP
ncbi:MAG: CbiQ family ECF transporter T component, partial [Nitrosomonadales bacterium]|nr:CbiQ family ECF transporter T component [Nitrosomonadales bacterium]